MFCSAKKYKHSLQCASRQDRFPEMFANVQKNIEVEVRPSSFPNFEA